MKACCHAKLLTRRILSGCLGLALMAGCTTTSHYTAFAPVDASLEHIPGGGARYLVMVNSSGKVLHNVKFSGFIRDDDALVSLMGETPTRGHKVNYTFNGSLPKWDPGEKQRFINWHNRQLETSIMGPVSRIELIGRCDEGRFRQGWTCTRLGDLEPVGIPSPATQP